MKGYEFLDKLMFIDDDLIEAAIDFCSVVEESILLSL